MDTIHTCPSGEVSVLWLRHGELSTASWLLSSVTSALGFNCMRYRYRFTCSCKLVEPQLQDWQVHCSVN